MGNSIVFGRFFDAPVATAVSVTNTLGTLAFTAISGCVSAIGVIMDKTIGAGKLIRDAGRAGVCGVHVFECGSDFEVLCGSGENQSV